MFHDAPITTSFRGQRVHVHSVPFEKLVNQDGLAGHQ